MMNWPPPETFWPTKLYVELPPDADHVRFRLAVEQAARIYQREAADAAKAPPWAEIIKAFDRVLKETRRFNSSHPVRPYLLKDVHGSREHAAFQLQYEHSRAQERRERLYHNLLVACVDNGGLVLSNSSAGPLSRTFKAIANFIYPCGGRDDLGLSDGGVRRIIQREIERRLERERRLVTSRS
jgi:hypothetical protein